MAYFVWSGEYSVGIKKLDDEHKTLIGYLNDLYDAMKRGEGKDTLNEVFNGLLQYTRSHFTSEEALMRLHQFPDYPAHKQKHDKMAEHVKNLKGQFDRGEIGSPIQITNFLKDWLSKHIKGTDREYGPFLKAKGVK